MVKRNDLSSGAGEVLQRIVDAMSMPELKDYSAYLDGKGYMPRDIGEIHAMQELYDLNFLIARADLVNPRPAYLTKAAWNRFQIAEWSEVEREIEISKSGPEFGSW